MSDTSTIHFVHPGNPFSPDPDGIVSVQRNFVRAAPDDLRFVYWGAGRPGAVAEDGAERDERLAFHPVVHSATQRPRVPLSLRFAGRMLRVRRGIQEGVLRFDRVESALPFLRSTLPMILFLHTWTTVDVRSRDTESRWRRAVALYERVFARVVRRADLVFVLRPDMADALASSLPDGVARLRPFGVPVDLSLFRPMSARERTATRGEWRASLGIEPGSAVMVFAGRLEGQKRPLVLPALAARLTEDGRPVHVLVAGSGSLEPALRDAAAREAPGRIHLLGSVPQDRLALLLGAADALVLPSAFEGLPNVLLEALAAGTPVVAARHGGRTAEVLANDKAGLVAGPEPAELAAAVRSVLAWRGRGVRKRRRLAEGFGAEALNRPIYEEVRGLVRAGDRRVSERVAGRVGPLGEVRA